jgi:hypothetical protein
MLVQAISWAKSQKGNPSLELRPAVAILWASPDNLD